mmetsp:Transcript_3922/g.10274  ORF Transcript_3922/g.10274 Transcript_3922/m.10274 type:complete len:268 (-) Transcript_3922:327-1130(-)
MSLYGCSKGKSEQLVLTSAAGRRNSSRRGFYLDPFRFRVHPSPRSIDSLLELVARHRFRVDALGRESVLCGLRWRFDGITRQHLRRYAAGLEVFLHRRLRLEGDLRGLRSHPHEGVQRPHDDLVLPAHLEWIDRAPPHAERGGRVDLLEGGDELLVRLHELLDPRPVLSPPNQDLPVLAHVVEGGLPEPGLHADVVVGLDLREELGGQLGLGPRQSPEGRRARDLVRHVGAGGPDPTRAHHRRGSGSSARQIGQRSAKGVPSGGAVR